MESDKRKIAKGQDLFDHYSEEINKAYERAVREAMLMHKRAGNPIAIGENGKVVIVQPEDIDVSE